MGNETSITLAAIVEQSKDEIMSILSDTYSTIGERYVEQGITTAWNALEKSVAAWDTRPISVKDNQTNVAEWAQVALYADPSARNRSLYDINWPFIALRKESQLDSAIERTLMQAAAAADAAAPVTKPAESAVKKGPLSTAATDAAKPASRSDEDVLKYLLEHPNEIETTAANKAFMERMGYVKDANGKWVKKDGTQQPAAPVTQGDDKKKDAPGGAMPETYGYEKGFDDLWKRLPDTLRNNRNWMKWATEIQRGGHYQQGFEHLVNTMRLQDDPRWTKYLTGVRGSSDPSTMKVDSRGHLQKEKEKEKEKEVGTGYNAQNQARNSGGDIKGTGTAGNKLIGDLTPKLAELMSNGSITEKDYNAVLTHAQNFKADDVEGALKRISNGSLFEGNRVEKQRKGKQVENLVAQYFKVADNDDKTVVDKAAADKAAADKAAADKAAADKAAAASAADGGYVDGLAKQSNIKEGLSFAGRWN